LHKNDVLQWANPLCDSYKISTFCAGELAILAREISNLVHFG